MLFIGVTNCTTLSLQIDVSPIKKKVIQIFNNEMVKEYQSHSLSYLLVNFK